MTLVLTTDVRAVGNNNSDVLQRQSGRAGSLKSEKAVAIECTASSSEGNLLHVNATRSNVCLPLRSFSVGKADARGEGGESQD